MTMRTGSRSPRNPPSRGGRAESGVTGEPAPRGHDVEGVGEQVEVLLGALAHDRLRGRRVVGPLGSAVQNRHLDEAVTGVVDSPRVLDIELGIERIGRALSDWGVV